MKIHPLTLALTFLLGSSLFSSAYADSQLLIKEHGFQNHQQQGKTRHKEKQQKQIFQHQGNHSEKSTSKMNSKHKQDDKNIQKQKRQNDKKIETLRFESEKYRKYDQYPRPAKKHSNKPDRIHVTNRYNYSHDRDNHRRYEVRHGKRLILSTPRHRIFHNIHISRPYGHSYFGYGHYLNDHNAWRWLTFTAITLKMLDLVDEQAQREHEAAQIAATTADVGERIYWDTDDATGYVVTTREGRTSSGLPCREYQQSITVGGRTEEAYGTACLQADGAWKIVD